jgi:hypothetical protein
MQDAKDPRPRKHEADMVCHGGYQCPRQVFSRFFSFGQTRRD